MAFGDVVRSAASPFSGPFGIGGDSTTIWHADNDPGDKVYELETSDFSVSRSSTAPSTYPTGMGGDSTTIWHANYSGVVYELETSDFSVSRSAASPGTQSYGIGGDSTTIWHCESATDQVYELETSDLSVSRSAASRSNGLRGIGGDSSVIWHVDTNTNQVYELKTSDLSVSRSAAAPSASPSGIGGDSTTIWHTESPGDKVYELDEAPVVAPTVTTQAADLIEATTARGNGNITNTGGENCDIRGIVWDLASQGAPGNVAPGASGYANDVAETDSFGTGAFTRSLTGLPPGTTIYARAYAHNSAGYAYGDEVSFTTLSLKKHTFRLDPKPRTRMSFHPNLKLG